ncbi:MAG: malate synthase G [Alteromonadaceae bacterium]|nr:malate synthase G [Alteromonadaceae bacterium]
MAQYEQIGRLSIHPELFDFIEDEALENSGVSSKHFWQSFESLIEELQPKNKALLVKRDEIQSKLDEYCRNTSAEHFNFADYKTFLKSIGYLVEAPEDTKIDTQNVDAEIATMAGPQLVVPINNARYALNAANARWGSLYDALYGTDVIPKQASQTKGYDEARGAKVIAYARKWLDTHFQLASGSFSDATLLQVADNTLSVILSSGETVKLADNSKFVGYRGEASEPSSILLKNNGLHAEIVIDSQSPIGKTDSAHIKDINLEAALTTIMDCEDSVAAVDGEDKTLVYRNWLGLMNGTLSTKMSKGGHEIVRTLAQDKQFIAANGEHVTLPGRSLMFIRNVGHLMTNSAILFDGEEVYEGIMDAMITTLIAKQDVLNQGKYSNSRTGSIYIVKPKMHGPEEVAFANELFECVEVALGLTKNTIKMGIMDEERRTSVNLKACIAQAPSRVAFINTGFLDRTGDEIHTSMLIGAFHPKATLKAMPWIKAYERSNVARGLECDLDGTAQIGKGMWPEPDSMAAMMKAKTGHPEAGASTAWVPSPTAATLHAMHYHQIDVSSVQATLKGESFDGLDDILSIPFMAQTTELSAQDIQNELDNNVQGILGYVVRWVHQGVGCSKVPDINNVGLMEDRATLRISSQHIANWLAHGLVTEQQVRDSLARLAKLVDEQNTGDAEYINMCPDLNDSIAFQAACELIFEGKAQPNGYTEPVLHKKRLEMKAKLAS